MIARRDGLQVTGGGGRKTDNRGVRSSVVRHRSVLIFMLMAILLVHPTPAQAQTAAPFVTIITVTVLDEDGQPLAFLPIELILFKYAESIEAVAVGGCGTDDTGSCSIEVTDPPQASGWMEGLVYIPGLGKLYIGWTGAEKPVTIQLLPGNVMATPEGFLHPPYEGQPASGTDVPLGLERVATLTTTPAIEPSATHTPLPPSPTSTTTPTTLPVSDTATVTATPTAAAILSDRQPHNDEYTLLLAAALIFPLILGSLTFWLYRRDKHTS